MASLRSMRPLVLALLLLPPVVESRFERLKRHLDGSQGSSYVFGNISLTLGTADGEAFSYQNADMTTRSRMPLGSGSKWPAATALLAMINYAKVDLDAPMSRYLTWWTKDPRDPRSFATIRHFLTMTSGMVADGTDSKLDGSDAAVRKAYGQKQMPTWVKCLGTHAMCIRKLYEASPALYAPGQYFMYGTMTFNYVAAVLEVVLKKGIGTLLREFLLKPLGMKAFWLPPFKPILGGGLVASAEDMGKFLQAMLRKSFLPPALHDEQERMALRYEQYSTQNAAFGPYGMGVWGECIDGQWTEEWPQECRAAQRFGHPGCFGYWNYINRRDGYYFNFSPKYTCDASNAWCGTGHAPEGPESCPQLGPAQFFRESVATFVEDAMRSQGATAGSGAAGAAGAAPAEASAGASALPVLV